MNIDNIEYNFELVNDYMDLQQKVGLEIEDINIGDIPLHLVRTTSLHYHLIHGFPKRMSYMSKRTICDGISYERTYRNIDSKEELFEFLKLLYAGITTEEICFASLEKGRKIIAEQDEKIKEREEVEEAKENKLNNAIKKCQELIKEINLDVQAFSDDSKSYDFCINAELRKYFDYFPYDATDLKITYNDSIISVHSKSEFINTINGIYNAFKAGLGLSSNEKIKEKEFEEEAEKLLLNDAIEKCKELIGKTAIDVYALFGDEYHCVGHKLHDCFKFFEDISDCLALKIKYYSPQEHTFCTVYAYSEDEFISRINEIYDICK